MKGISVILAIVLLVIATLLPDYLRKNGKLPSHANHKDAPDAGLTFAKRTTSGLPVKL